MGRSRDPIQVVSRRMRVMQLSRDRAAPAHVHPAAGIMRSKTDGMRSILCENMNFIDGMIVGFLIGKCVSLIVVILVLRKYEKEEMGE